MKNILVATDFSNNAYNALFHATKLLKDNPCTFYLLNAYDEFTPLHSKSAGKDLAQQLKEESNEGLKSVFHRIQLDKVGSKHTFKMISEQGALVDAIVKIVEKKDIDLVVMGNSGRSEIEAIFMGSNALDTIGHVKKCPILTIPKEIDFEPPKDIAFVTDYGRAYDDGLLQPLLLMAKQYDSRIRVMHINEAEVLDKYQFMNRSVLLDYLLPFEHTFHWMPLFKSKATAINTFLQEFAIDMLVMVNYEHSILERMTREPVIKRVAFDLNIPFLIIPTWD